MDNWALLTCKEDHGPGSKTMHRLLQEWQHTLCPFCPPPCQSIAGGKQVPRSKATRNGHSTAANCQRSLNHRNCRQGTGRRCRQPCCQSSRRTRPNAPLQTVTARIATRALASFPLSTGLPQCFTKLLHTTACAHDLLRTLRPPPAASLHIS